MGIAFTYGGTACDEIPRVSKYGNLGYAWAFAGNTFVVPVKKRKPGEAWKELVAKVKSPTPIRKDR